MPVRHREVGSFADDGASRRDGALLFARTTHGLERLAATEAEERGAAVVASGKRLLVIRAPIERIGELALRTIDDLFRLVLAFGDPGAGKRDLAVLRAAVVAADLSEAVLQAPAAPAIPGDRRRPVTVTASFTGRRSYTRYDLEDTVGPVIAEGLGTDYVSRRGGSRPPMPTLDWRLSMDTATALLGPRIASVPLHRRPWRTATVAGSLHPPVAAAMVRLAGIGPGHLVLDPCCGAGTLAIEAADLRTGAWVHGSDRDPSSVHLAAANGRTRPGITWTVADTRKLPFGDSAVDRIVTNPPWGKQVSGNEDFAGFLAEWRRVLRGDGVLVCLVPSHQRRLIRESDGWHVLSVHPVSLAGQHPLIVRAQPTS
ncbi:TRM11 family SAM-dependent methyltransferase [Lysobacter korlensis]|uniref:TRM11 family SAM-dependent methyltransferase n=1 Tax=Lysobacter korlensis TaxID=553636 RepID=A0ABV6S3F5_9GAMM